MKLYKFRSLHGDGLLHALDMIIHQRIYLSTVEKMNDPHEGGFDVEIKTPRTVTELHRDQYLEKSHRLRELISKARFTCFTTTAVEPLLWAHYAGGYSGVAFEYDIPNESDQYAFKSIQYSGISPPISERLCDDILEGREKFYNHGVLCAKKREWRYEKEVRVFSAEGNSHYSNLSPTCVIVASTSPGSEIFRAICEMNNIRIGYLMPSRLDSGYTIYYPDSQ